MTPATLRHVDAGLVVAEKPCGLLAVPGRGAHKADCLWSRVRAAHDDARVVHRLDEATSGLMLFARGLEAQRCLTRAFERREIAKRYVAVVAGRMAADRGAIELPLAADWPRRPRQKVDVHAGRDACTDWRVLDRAADGSWTRVELQPITGRSHQLRVHLLALGHPILGDALYAPPDVREAAPRLLLHATALALAHPLDGRALAFESQAPF